ncbi:MAG TPA: hypothetical protein DDY37_06710 [Legionella sp.]|nr:hypothetical protein [Legionella sp.]
MPKPLDPLITPPILALHGWLENSASFVPLCDLLSDYYVIAPDLPGHGYSPHLPPNIAYTLEAHALILLCALDQLGWGKFSILGHSIGAGIGTLLSAAVPEKVSHLIMIDKLGPPALSEKSYLEQFRLTMQSRTRRKEARLLFYKTRAEAVQIRCMISGWV